MQAEQLKRIHVLQDMEAINAEVDADTRVLEARCVLMFVVWFGLDWVTGCRHMMTTQTHHNRRIEVKQEIVKWEGIVQEAAEAKLEADTAEAEAGVGEQKQGAR